MASPWLPGGHVTPGFPAGGSLCCYQAQTELQEAPFPQQTPLQGLLPRWCPPLNLNTPPGDAKPLRVAPPTPGRACDYNTGQASGSHARLLGGGVSSLTRIGPLLELLFSTCKTRNPLFTWPQSPLPARLLETSSFSCRTLLPTRGERGRSLRNPRLQTKTQYTWSDVILISEWARKVIPSFTNLFNKRFVSGTGLQ